MRHPHSIFSPGNGDPPSTPPECFGSRDSEVEGTKRECRVLIVEDDPATLEAVAEILEGEGVSACRARHGQEALDILRAGTAPGLIIIDLMMPVMDGWEFCRQVAADQALAGIPIAIVTAAPAIERLPARRNDAGLFRKPVDYRRLLEVVRRYSG